MNRNNDSLHLKMRFFVVFVALSCVLVETLSRPSRLEQPNSSEEVEYGGYDVPDSVHSLGSEDDTRLDQESKADQDDRAVRGRRVLDHSENEYLQRNPGNFPVRASSMDNFSDLNPVNIKRDDTLEDPLVSDKDYQALLKRNLANRNFGNRDDDQSEQVQHLTGPGNNNNYKSSRFRGDTRDNTLRKRTIGTPSNAADLLFESTGNNRDKPNEPNKSEYNNEAVDSSEQSRYFKKYYNTMQAENRRALDDRNYENLNVNNINRDRRQVEIEQKDTVNLSSTSNKEDMNEDEETAIKRHIKKLSSNELEELMETLSDDKKTLLKKIMDSEGDNSYESINKREITKKAGAVEENNDENGQSDLSKVQGGSSEVNSQTAQNPDTTETTKQSESQTENNENLTSTKNNNIPENSEKTELANQGDQTNQLNSGSGSDSFAMNTDNIVLDSLASDISKTQNKRETNEEKLKTNGSSLDDSKISDASNDPGNVFSPDEDLSQLFDEEYQLHSDNKNTREANIEEQSLISDSIKSLEESFPNSNSYDDSDPYAGSDMAPLIRVKRKNANIQKRAAGVLADNKVAFCPFIAENDDEDNDEGNEFDDEGFYDRTSNYAKNNANNKPLDDDLKANDFNFPSRRSMSNIINSQINDDTVSRSKYSLNGKSHQNLANIGSDTDSVLSGVEGVDENLMLNSASRNRRTLEFDNAKKHSEDIATQPQDDSVKYNGIKSSENYSNAPNYQENDAFGPLPRNYEGELGRYKRIRRVKQPATSEDIASTNT